MGIFNLISKAVDVLPTVIDFLDKYGGESNESSNINTGDPDELIEDCEEYLIALSKHTIDDLDEFLDCLTKFERKWLKLDRIDSNSNDKRIGDELYRLDREKEHVLLKMEDRINAMLDKINAESKEEKDPEKWLALNDEWNKHHDKSQRILDHKIKYAEKLSKQANLFIND